LPPVQKSLKIMKQFFMPLRTILLGILSLAGTMLSSHVAGKGTGVTLYTPYTKISVPPGQSIDYTIDIINNTSLVKNVSVSLNNLPKGWSYDLKSGGWAIGELSVLPGEKKNVNLHIDVPYKVDKGIYHFTVAAPGIALLPLTVIVSEQGTYRTEFTTKQPNMEGNANAAFTFSAELKNRTGEKQLYALRAQTPPGWNIAFKVSGRQVTSVQAEPNHTESVTIEVDPPDAIEAGTYKIPVAAVTSSTSANLDLEVVVTGSYSLEMTTPSGLLSTAITVGDTRRIALQLRNNGSSPLKNIKLSHAAPTNWDVVFEPAQVEVIEPGKTAEVYATIQADDKAIAGDYVTNLEAKTPEVSSKVSLRVSVQTSMVYGWIGVLIMGGAVGTVYSLFRKYGRR
jgi:uncharacterized membrane protein